MPRLVALDGLRGVAAALVVLFHLKVPGFEGGWIGVDVFFVLSGYLITTLLLGERRSTGRVDLVGFWARRLARLYPALVLMVAFGWLGAHRFEALQPYTVSAALALTYTTDLIGYVTPTGRTGLTHTWSLAVEEQFYLLWPLLVVAVKGRARPLVGIGVVASAAGVWALTAAGPVPPDHGALYFVPSTRGWEILVGCLLAFALPKVFEVFETFESFEPGRVDELRAAASAILWLAVPGFVLVVMYVGRPGLALGVAVPLAVGFSAVVVAALVVAPRALPARALALAPIAWLGRVSYGLYLYHWVVFRLLPPRLGGLPVPVRWAVLLAASVAVAAVSYHLVEEPVQRAVRRRLARRAPAVADLRAVETTVAPFVVRARRSDHDGGGAADAAAQYTPAAGFALAYATAYAPAPADGADYPDAVPPAPESSGWVSDLFPPQQRSADPRSGDVDVVDLRPADAASDLPRRRRR